MGRTDQDPEETPSDVGGHPKLTRTRRTRRPGHADLTADPRPQGPAGEGRGWAKGGGPARGERTRTSSRPLRRRRSGWTHPRQATGVGPPSAAQTTRPRGPSVPPPVTPSPHQDPGARLTVPQGYRVRIPRSPVGAGSRGASAPSWRRLGGPRAAPTPHARVRPGTTVRPWGAVGEVPPPPAAFLRPGRPSTRGGLADLLRPLGPVERKKIGEKPQRHVMEFQTSPHPPKSNQLSPHTKIGQPNVIPHIGPPTMDLQ